MSQVARTNRKGGAECSAVTKEWAIGWVGECVLKWGGKSGRSRN